MVTPKKGANLITLNSPLLKRFLPAVTRMRMRFFLTWRLALRQVASRLPVGQAEAAVWVSYDS